LADVLAGRAQNQSEAEALPDVLAVGQPLGVARPDVQRGVRRGHRLAAVAADDLGLAVVPTPLVMPLVAQACAAAFTQRLADMDEALETTDNAEAARRAWLEVYYLSPGHRDSPENGCAAAALAGDVARAPDGAALRDAYLDGLKSTIEKMGRLGNRPADPEAREQEVLVELATAVGAVVLSRAIAGDDLSERLLAAVRRHLIDE
jgi:hypothetical protein